MFELTTIGKDRTRKDNPNKNTIIKFSGKERFVDVTQAFEIGKIKFTFCTYDESQPVGKKITSEINCYINIDEAMYLAKICINDRLFKMASRNEKQRREQNYKIAKPSYENFSGSTRNNEIMSKHLFIRMKGPDEKNAANVPFSLIGEERPGELSPTGAITPLQNSERRYIAIGLTAEQIVYLGAALERAVNIYDTWQSLGLLEKKLRELSGKYGPSSYPNKENNNTKKPNPVPNQDTSQDTYYENKIDAPVSPTPNNKNTTKTQPSLNIPGAVPGKISKSYQNNKRSFSQYINQTRNE